jgi:hypothetical protein
MSGKDKFEQHQYILCLQITRYVYMTLKSTAREVVIGPNWTRVQERGEKLDGELNKATRTTIAGDLTHETLSGFGIFSDRNGLIGGRI